MNIQFHKYQGAGNDFIIIDNRRLFFDDSNHALIQRLCDRKLGIGADGLILLKDVTNYDFEMVYYNADGHLGSMCGNGGRCVVDFAKQLNIFEKECHFLAYDGPHLATWTNSNVSLRMQNVEEIESGEDYFFLDTGSPHYVKFVESLESINVIQEGQKIRYNERFKNYGTNVNFVQIKNQKLYIRTYERGVEDETLACGTGVIASVLSAYEAKLISNNSVEVIALGGDLKVNFEKNIHYHTINLLGPYDCVYKGEIVC
jgi:diaminopimelate epimerase